MTEGRPLTGLDALRRYAAAVNEKKDLDTRIKALGAEIERLSPAVLQHFEANGVRSVTIDDAVVFLRTEHWASKVEGLDERMSPMDIRLHFIDADMGEYCEPRINVQGLSAWMREQIKQAEERARLDKRNALDIEPDEVIPDQLKGIVTLKTVIKLGARRAR